LQRGKGLVKVKIREREGHTYRQTEREGHTDRQTERDTHSDRDRYRNGEL
jgi:hypothetical protein